MCFSLSNDVGIVWTYLRIIPRADKNNMRTFEVARRTGLNVRNTERQSLIGALILSNARKDRAQELWRFICSEFLDVQFVNPRARA